MSFINDLLEKPTNLSTASKYTVMNGVIYLGTGALLIAWPDVTQTLFRDAAFVEHERGLMRAIGLSLAVIGWLYFFGGRSGARQIVAASVVDRLIFVPAVLVPLVMAGVFPHLFVTLAILDRCSPLVLCFSVARQRLPPISRTRFPTGQCLDVAFSGFLL